MAGNSYRLLSAYRYLPLTLRHVYSAQQDEPTQDENSRESQMTAGERDPLLFPAETSSDSEFEDVNFQSSQTTAEQDSPFPGAVTGLDSDSGQEEEPETPSSIVGAVLVVLSAAVFALAERCLSLCKAAGAVTSHLLLLRSVSFFTLNLAAMTILAVVKSHVRQATGPDRSNLRVKSQLPMLIAVGMATTVATLLTSLSYLFDIPGESFQAFILTMTPTYTTTFSFFLTGDKFAAKKVWPMAVCFVGSFIYIVGVPKPESDKDTMQIKYIIVLFLPLVVSIAFVTARALLKNNVHPTTVVFSVQLTSILFLLPFTLRYVYGSLSYAYETLSYGNIFNYSTEIWVAMFGYIACHCTATYLLYFGLKYEKAGIVQVLLGGIIPFSLVLSYAMFGRVPFPSQTIGGAIIAIGVAALVGLTCWESPPCSGDVHVTVA
uniref:EamA domain-containing protein n=1 Tax=Branchiostoma floridae TaxID=7739 RepID=C3XVI1_BRAFL|eukprot:XP_002612098.1 hypothetical protein BRAFLDRAFT_104814 [Branchiostoma floridae]